MISQGKKYILENTEYVINEYNNVFCFYFQMNIMVLYINLHIFNLNIQDRTENIFGLFEILRL